MMENNIMVKFFNKFDLNEKIKGIINFLSEFKWFIKRLIPDMDKQDKLIWTYIYKIFLPIYMLLFLSIIFEVIPFVWLFGILCFDSFVALLNTITRVICDNEEYLKPYKIRFIENSIIPFSKSHSSMMLFGLVFTKKPKHQISNKLRNHETIHKYQMKETGYIIFYILYLVEYFVWLLKYRNTDKAYRSIAFEEESFKYQEDSTYLKNRLYYVWIDTYFNNEELK